MYNPHLTTFIAVADAGSFSKAADSLFVTPTALIKQINILERNLNLKLFERTHRGIFLTDAGKSLYKDAEYMIQYAKDSINRAQHATPSGNAVIRIGSSPITPANILMELWPKIHEIYPEIHFKLVPFENTPENAREILMNLGQNIDMVAGIFDPASLISRQCTGFILSEEPLCIAVSLNHPLAPKNKVTPEDLFGEKLMLIKRGWTQPMDTLRDDLERNYPQIEILDFDFYNTDAFNQCQNGSYCLVAIQNWQNVHPLLKIIPVEWPHTTPFGLLYSPQPSPVVQSCIDAISQVYNLDQQK